MGASGRMRPELRSVVLGCAREAEAAVFGHWCVTHGYERRNCASSNQWLDQLLEGDAALAVLDLEFGGDGMSLLRTARQRAAAVPLFCIGDRDSELSWDRVLGFPNTDFVLRPFAFREAHARLGTLLRGKSGGYVVAIEHRGVRVDLPRQEVKARGQRVSLTPTEYRILLRLIERPGAVVSSADITSEVLATHGEGNSVRVHIGNLRAKLRDADCPSFIKTARGAGYFVPADAAQCR